MTAHVGYYKKLGRYNWAGTEKDWCVQLSTPYGNVSEMWPEDDEPDLDDALPSEVLQMIEDRLDHYWISTGRDTRKAVIAAIREHESEIDAAWLDAQIERTERVLSGLRERRAVLDEEAQP